MTSLSRPLAISATQIDMPFRELVLWVFSAGACAILFRFFFVGNPAMFLTRIAYLNVFEVGAAAVCAWRMLRFQSDRQATRSDAVNALLLLVLLVAMGFFPFLYGFSLFMIFFGLFLIRKNETDRNLFAAALVMLSLAGHFLIAPIIFRICIAYIVEADVFLVGSVLQYMDPSIQLRGTSFVSSQRPDQFAVILIGACSSFNNISAAVLVHVAWAMALRDHLTRLDGLAMLGTVVVATALNVMRIALSVSSPDSYAFWHGYDGSLTGGAALFIVLQNVTLVVAGYLTARWAGRSSV